MFRMTGKTSISGHTIKYVTIENSSRLNRTRKVFDSLYEICRQFDLPVPQWLNGNIAEFGRISKTRFCQDSFIEEIPFDFLEIEIIEED